MTPIAADCCPHILFYKQEHSHKHQHHPSMALIIVRIPFSAWAIAIMAVVTAVVAFVAVYTPPTHALAPAAPAASVQPNRSPSSEAIMLSISMRVSLAMASMLGAGVATMGACTVTTMR